MLELIVGAAIAALFQPMADEIAVDLMSQVAPQVNREDHPDGWFGTGTYLVTSGLTAMFEGPRTAPSPRAVTIDEVVTSAIEFVLQDEPEPVGPFTATVRQKTPPPPGRLRACSAYAQEMWPYVGGDIRDLVDECLRGW